MIWAHGFCPHDGAVSVHAATVTVEISDVNWNCRAAYGGGSAPGRGDLPEPCALNPRGPAGSVLKSLDIARYWLDEALVDLGPASSIPTRIVGRNLFGARLALATVTNNLGEVWGAEVVLSNLVRADVALTRFSVKPDHRVYVNSLDDIASSLGIFRRQRSTAPLVVRAELALLAHRAERLREKLKPQGFGGRRAISDADAQREALAIRQRLRGLVRRGFPPVLGLPFHTFFRIVVDWEGASERTSAATQGRLERDREPSQAAVRAELRLVNELSPLVRDAWHVDSKGVYLGP